MAVFWYCFAFIWGVAAGFLGAEFGQYGRGFAGIGVAIAVGLAILPVRLAKRRNKGVPTLLTYSAGIEAVALWIGVPAVLQQSGGHYENTGATLSFAA